MEDRIVTINGGSYKRGILDQSRLALFGSLTEIENVLPACNSLLFTACEPAMKHPLRRARFAELLTEDTLGLNDMAHFADELSRVDEQDLEHEAEYRKL